jgi:hypothetical protein
MLFWTPSGPARIAEPRPVASSRRMPNRVSWRLVTAVACPAGAPRRKKGSKLEMIEEAGPGRTTPAGRHSPSGDTGVASVQISRAHCAASPAISASSATE